VVGQPLQVQRDWQLRQGSGASEGSVSRHRKLGQRFASLSVTSNWCRDRFFDLVGDQGQDPLAHYEVDESFLDDLRDAIKDTPLS
jgi:hypothetical protein